MKLSPEALMCGSCCNLAQEFLRTAETRRKEEQDRRGMLWDSFLMGITSVLSVFPCVFDDTLTLNEKILQHLRQNRVQKITRFWLPGLCGGSL